MVPGSTKLHAGRNFSPRAMFTRALIFGPPHLASKVRAGPRLARGLAPAACPMEVPIMTSTWRRAGLALGLSLSIFAAGCDDDDDTPTTPSSPAPQEPSPS